MLNITSHLLPHFDERAAGVTVDTLVIHSMYAKEFPDPLALQACYSVLDGCKVSAHYLVSPEGVVWRCVPEEKRGWHAGVSKMPFADDAREGVNHFSIGIELLATEVTGFTAEQYETLALLTLDIIGRWPISAIVGHEHIAPGRKVDPGDNFDWPRYRAMVESGLGAGRTIRFPR